MSMTKPVQGAGGAELGCLCKNKTFKIICWCGGHVDISCSSCGAVIDHSDVKVCHYVKVHHDGVTCPECAPPKDDDERH